jgi:hypothetical protein
MIAYAVLQYTMNTSADVHGKKGKGNFKLPAAEGLPAD